MDKNVNICRAPEDFILIEDEIPDKDKDRDELERAKERAKAKLEVVWNEMRGKE